MQCRTLTAFLAAALAVVAAIVPGSAASAASPITLTNGFYVDPGSGPAVWVASHPTDGRTASIKASIAAQPIAHWFTNSSGSIGTAVGGYVGAAKSAGKLPILVAYNIPGRDACGNASAGGAADASAYRTWISAFADSIKDRPAIVVIEPDALADFACMNAAQIATRTQLLNFATQQFRDRSPNSWAYLDAGHSNWTAADIMAARLNSAGLSNIHGFALNVSNFHTTATQVTYGNSINGHLSASGYTRPFIVDTSRNGNGSNGVWCNPAGRKLGVTARLGGGPEAMLWVKTPGRSDGKCGTAPTVPAGTFDPQLAYNLVYGY